MDDFTPYCGAFETTLDHLEKVLEFYLYNKVSLSTEKCDVMMTEGIVLGHYIYAKIEVILKIPTPKMRKEVGCLLGHPGYYKRFIENFSNYITIVL